MKNNEKTVFVLGAGASYSANIPTQNELIKVIYSIKKSSFKYDKKATSFVNYKYNINEEALKEYYDDFNDNRIEVGKFILENFSFEHNLIRYLNLINRINEIKSQSIETDKIMNNYLDNAFDIVSKVDVSLEALFTTFDNSISLHEHYKKYSEKEMIELNRKTQLCIVYAIYYRMVKKCNNSDYNNFCDYLISYIKNSNKKYGELAIITTNWDDVLEKCLLDKCNIYNEGKSRKIYPDLCFYDYSLDNSKNKIPSTYIQAKGHKSIKLLKMHGSLSWLECPRCKRIYVDYKKDIGIDEYKGIACPKCNKIIKKEDECPKLKSLILTPTFMKSLDSLIIKSIWQNAFMDLDKATKIVFIGYSLPEADFEMKCLLKKAIKDETKIEVVLSEKDNPLYFDKILTRKIAKNKRDEIINRINLPEHRYRTFFGNNRVIFDYSGFGKYIKKLKKEMKI